MSIAVGIGCVHAARDLHNNLLSRTMRLPMSFFDCTPLGRIMNRFSKDVDVIDNLIPMILRLWFMMIFNVSRNRSFLLFIKITFCLTYRLLPFSWLSAYLRQFSWLSSFLLSYYIISSKVFMFERHDN